MSENNSEIESLIAKIESAHKSGSFKNYIEYIRFPFYKNLELNSKIEFDFPLTVMVGPNGSGKSSALQGIYGMPDGYSPGHFWFSTKVDPIADDDNNRHCLIYGHKGDGDKIVEVLKTRIGEAKGSHYWEPSRPLKKYGMKTLKGSRNPTVKKNVVYLDFRSALSAYDRFFYFSNFKTTKTFKSKQDLVSGLSKHLKHSIDNSLEKKHYSRKISKPIILGKQELDAVNKILEKDYIECKLINHNLYSKEQGLTIYFKTKDINYSEAFAGRGEFAVVKLVHEIMKADQYSLIILDEPEVSLHPGAQEKLLEFLLKQTLEKKLQIVIATHSEKFLLHLPEKSIKLYFHTKGIRFGIQNRCHYLEAFKFIGHKITPSDKKIIYVEDILAKYILDKILEDLNNEFPIMFEVKYLPGGVEDLKKRTSGFSQENEANKFVILDGDKTKPQIDPSLLTVKESGTFKELDKKIKEIIGMDFNSLGFSIDSKGTSGGDENQKITLSLKYLSYVFSNLDYFPNNKIPEDIIWDTDYANNILKTAHISSTTFTNDNKKNIYHFTKLYTGDQTDGSYKTCCKLFIKEFVRKKGVDYTEIVKILNKFKSITVD